MSATLPFESVITYNLTLAALARHVEHLRDLPAGSVDLVFCEGGVAIGSAGWTPGSLHRIVIDKFEAQTEEDTAIMALFDLDPSQHNPGIIRVLLQDLVWVRKALPHGSWIVEVA